ncbi:MAG: hypothetical protein QXY99_07115 [Thermoproteota archaeon]
MRVNRIKISIDAFVDQPKTLHHKFLLDPDICYYTCQCCRAYLEWRPGRADYSNFEAVFRQVAEDLCEAWKRAVDEAAASEEIDSAEVVITSGQLPNVNVRGETAEKTRKMTRKVKVT